MNICINNLINRKEFRFIIVGVINTIVGYGAYAILLLFGFQYLIANTVATVIGVANSYLWNRFFTFKSKAKARNEIVRFSIVYMVSYFFSMIFLYLIVGHLNVNTYFAGVMNIVITTIISWYGHKYFSFKDAK